MRYPQPTMKTPRSARRSFSRTALATCTDVRGNASFDPTGTIAKRRLVKYTGTRSCCTYREGTRLWIYWLDTQTSSPTTNKEQTSAILGNERKYSTNASLIHEAMRPLMRGTRSPPEQHTRAQAKGEWVERTLDQADLDAKAQLHQQHSNTSTLYCSDTPHKQTESYSRQISTEPRGRGLNPKQRQVVASHRKDAIIAMRKGEPVKPYRVFLSPGGVGKSHVISLVHNDTIKLLRLLRPDGA